MAKVKIRCDAELPAARVDVLRIFDAFNVNCSKLLVPSEDREEFVAFCNSDLHAENIFF